jgi:hypothetical protein
MRSVTGAASAGLLVALAGCANGGGGGGATATAPPTAAVNGAVTPAPSGAPAPAASVQPVPGHLLCNVLTSEQVRSATGVDVAASVVNDGSGGTECDYRGTDGAAIVVVQDQSQQLLPLGATGPAVAAALRARGGATALSVTGADLALLSNATAVPSVFLLTGGHWFSIGLTAGAAPDPNGAVTTLAAEAVTLLSTEAQ